MIEFLRRKMVREGKPLSLRLYFSNREAYLRVYIWKHKSDMYVGAGVRIPDYKACYIPDSDDGRNKIGEVHFYEGFLNYGVVAHEFLHSIFDLAFKFNKKINPPKLDESPRSSSNKLCEFLCGELEYLTKYFWKKYYVLKS